MEEQELDQEPEFRAVAEEEKVFIVRRGEPEYVLKTVAAIRNLNAGVGTALIMLNAWCVEADLAHSALVGRWTFQGGPYRADVMTPFKLDEDRALELFEKYCLDFDLDEVEGYENTY